MEETDQNSCQICNRCAGKYMCPRCNISFCSVQCYQSDIHSVCSETFYKESVLCELKLENDDPEGQRKVLEILSRMRTEEQDELDSDDERDLSERLEGVDLDDADSVWKCLTECERQEFEALVREGDITDVLPLWEPWWTYRKEKALVQELDEACCTEEEPYIKTCPPLKTGIPHFSHLSKHPPAPDVKWNIINVLAAYCYVARYFNGDHKEQPLQAACLLERLSGVLRANFSYKSTEIAVDAVVQDILSCFGHTEETIYDDVMKVLRGPEESRPYFYVQAGLSDIHQLFTLAYKIKKSGSKRKTGEFSKCFKESLYDGHDITKEQLFLLKKKVEYFLAWVNEYLLNKGQTLVP
ncbi:zinc finger HIT domain-containing protein 2 [Schistocerca nitens]|uniref:zinc finger HIT domain-containing protein 2 n=1 Tax=Schistocerca nitens TaxID=7011 RepID=UPI0021177412|nr:zinc finger HIT domain-containing protein 2 [Schistocerca nitens]